MRLIQMLWSRNKFSYLYKDEKLEDREISSNFYEIFRDYKQTVDVNCEESVKSFNGFYGFKREWF